MKHYARPSFHADYCKRSQVKGAITNEALIENPWWLVSAMKLILMWCSAKRLSSGRDLVTYILQPFRLRARNPFVRGYQLLGILVHESDCMFQGCCYVTFANAKWMSVSAAGKRQVWTQRRRLVGLRKWESAYAGMVLSFPSAYVVLRRCH